MRLPPMCTAALLVAALSWTATARADETHPLLVSEDFEEGMSRWETTDPSDASSVWQIETVAGNAEPNHALRVTGPSQYQPPYRSPLSIAWLKDIVVGDFVLTAKIQNTNVSAGAHRDLCIFWGGQGPSQFYYAHLGAVRDPNSCQIFIVNQANRRPITDNKDQPLTTPWDNDWHTVKIVRDAQSGRMEVYFDNMAQPVMTAVDKTFTWGRVGLGTFDDNGNFDDVEIRGVVVEQNVSEAE
jgi:hypothetical protein